MKKILSILLSLLVLVSLLAISPIATQAVVAPGAPDKAVQWAIKTAADDTHGYSQAYDRRWGTPDYDCASFVICAYRSAGFKLPYAAHCSNIKEEFMKEGFRWIPNTEIDLSTSKYLKPGDVLLRIAGHTEIYIGNNQQCGAHDNYDGNRLGDTYGNEVCAYTYSNRSNWSGILRYEDNPVDIGTDFYGYILNNDNHFAITNDSALDSESRNASVRALTSTAPQIWKFERQADLSYKITSAYNDYSLDVRKAGTTPGTNIGVCESNDKNAQRWYFYGDEGSYKIGSKCNDLVMDANGTAEGTNLRMNTDTSAASQRFSIIKISAPQPTYVEAQASTPFEPTYIWWNMSLFTDAYDVKIYKAGTNELFKEINDCKDTVTQLELPVGSYDIVVYTKNVVGSVKSQNTATITVNKSEEHLLGDIDLDGEVAIMDATQIQQHLVGTKVLSIGQLSIADTDNDSEVAITDATKIQQYLAGIIASFS